MSWNFFTRNKDLLLKIFFAIANVALLSYCTSILYEYDFWWHLSVGRWILEHHTLMRVDTLSLTLPGFIWYDHEWFTNVLMAKLWMIGGRSALLPFFCLAIGLIGATFAFRAQTLFQQSLGFLFLASTRSFLGLRPQVISFLFFAFIVYAWQHRVQHKNILYAAPLIFLLWANMYGGVVFGIIFIAIVGFFSIVQRTCSRIHATIIGLCCLATLVNPFGIHLYSEIYRTQASPYMKNISEMVSGFTRLEYISILVIIFVVCACALLVRARAWGLIAATLFFLYAYGHAVKFWPYFAIIGFECVLEASSEFAWLMTRLRLSHEKIKRIGSWVISMEIIFVAVWSLFALHSRVTYPVGATIFLASLFEKQPQIRLYNEFETGGYIEWFVPGLPIFVDGHMPQWADAKGNAPYPESLRIMAGGAPVATEIFKKYDINTAMLPTASFQNKAIAQSFIKAGWKELYRDATDVILVAPAFDRSEKSSLK